MRDKRTDIRGIVFTTQSNSIFNEGNLIDSEPGKAVRSSTGLFTLDASRAAFQSWSRAPHQPSRRVAHKHVFKLAAGRVQCESGLGRGWVSLMFDA